MPDDRTQKETYASQKNEVSAPPNDDGTIEGDDSAQVRSHEDEGTPAPNNPSHGKNILIMAASFVILLIILAVLLMGAPALDCGPGGPTPGVDHNSTESPQDPVDGPVGMD